MSLSTGVYDPKAFVLHTASLGQTFVHCPRFPTAASRRSLDRVSVPVWLVALSRQLPVVGLVGRYLTNYLMGRGPLIERYLAASFISSACASVRIGHYPEFPRVIPVSTEGHPRVTHPSAVPTIPLRGLRHSTCNVLGTPSAFILSQDQTLRSEKHFCITTVNPTRGLRRIPQETQDRNRFSIGVSICS